MTLVRKLNRAGAIFIIIDSILELLDVMGKQTPLEIGFICLLLGVFIFLATPQLEYDYKVQWAAATLAAQWFAHSYLHGVLGYDWATNIAIIGMILVIIAGILVILGAALGVLVVQNIGLFKPHQYFLLGIEIIALHNSILYLFFINNGGALEQLWPIFFCYIFLGVMLFGTLLIWQKKKIAGSLIIWITCTINSTITGIDGFYGGAVILSLFAFVMLLFAFLDHWADPYTRKTRIPRRDLSMTIKDSFSWLLGILFILKSRKLKKKEQLLIKENE